MWRLLVDMMIHIAEAPVATSGLIRSPDGIFFVADNNL